jgi:putative membrane protein
MIATLKGVSKGELLIGLLIVSNLARCGASQHQLTTASVTPISAETRSLARDQTQSRSKHLTTHIAQLSLKLAKDDAAIILRQIHQTNLREIAIGRLAQQKASTTEVSAYAEQLVQDHANADRTVLAIAQKDHVQLQNGESGLGQAFHESTKEKQLEKRLRLASGPDFDRLFLQETNLDHESLIRTLKKDREDISDGELEDVIDKMIPVLEQHRELAQILMKKDQT